VTPSRHKHLSGKQPESTPVANRRLIGRVSIEVLDRSSAIKTIIEAVQSGCPKLVSFCNAHTANLAATDDVFASALDKFMILNDGFGVDLASRLLYGNPFPENLCGTDFVPDLLSSAGSGFRIFLLGSAPGVAEKAAATLKLLHPGHMIVGTRNGYFHADNQQAVCDQIMESRPNLLLVGMGQPRQELWAAQHFEKFEAVTMCVGAFLDFTAGTITRAPRWVRAARFEWAYRLALEPRRLAQRYLIGNFEFLCRMVSDKIARSLSR
jgi:alpha-1,3-mannosyltransferase